MQNNTSNQNQAPGFHNANTPVTASTPAERAREHDDSNLQTQTGLESGLNSASSSTFLRLRAALMEGTDILVPGTDTGHSFRSIQRLQQLQQRQRQRQRQHVPASVAPVTDETALAVLLQATLVEPVRTQRQHATQSAPALQSALPINVPGAVYLQVQAMLLDQEESLRSMRFMLQSQLEQHQQHHRAISVRETSASGENMSTESPSRISLSGTECLTSASAASHPVASMHPTRDQKIAVAAAATGAGAGAAKDDNSEDNVDDADTSYVDDDEYYASFGNKDSTTLNNEPFPYRLYRMLYELDKSGKADIVSFDSRGQVLCIHKPKTFVSDIMPKYFTTARLPSFQRQLNLYGFVRILVGRLRGGYQHKFFRKGKRELCRNIKRQKTRNRQSTTTASATQLRESSTNPSSGSHMSPSAAASIASDVLGSESVLTHSPPPSLNASNGRLSSLPQSHQQLGGPFGTVTGLRDMTREALVAQASIGTQVTLHGLVGQSGVTALGNVLNSSSLLRHFSAGNSWQRPMPISTTRSLDPRLQIQSLATSTTIQRQQQENALLYAHLLVTNRIAAGSLVTSHPTQEKSPGDENEKTT